MTQPDSTKRARALRRRSTEAESMLWSRLRRRQLAGRKFRGQHPIGPYVVDLLCVEEHLVVEVDGGQHSAASAEDAKRTAWFMSRGLRVLRFWNHDVLSNPQGVLIAIEQAFREKER